MGTTQPLEGLEKQEGRSSANRRRGKRREEQISGLPAQVRHSTWEVLFLMRELKGADTRIERAVILEWLEASKAKRAALEQRMIDELGISPHEAA